MSRARATIARQFLRAVGLPRIEAPTIDAETAARFKAAADRSLDTGETPATSPRCRSCSGSQKRVGSSFTARSVTTSMSSSPFAGRVTRRPSETSRPLQPEPPEFGVLDWAHWVAPKPVPPLFRVKIEPADFPFADSVVAHRFRESMLATVLKAAVRGRLRTRTHP